MLSPPARPKESFTFLLLRAELGKWMQWPLPSLLYSSLQAQSAPSDQKYSLSQSSLSAYQHLFKLNANFKATTKNIKMIYPPPALAYL